MSEVGEIQNKVLEFLRGRVFSPGTIVSEETDLIASGFDSLSMVSLLLFIEETYGLWIPEGELTEATFKNPRTLAAVVVRLIDERRAAP
jgi:acyl carrier protein